MKHHPTPKQLEVLNIIKQSIITRGYAPTLDEMSKEIGISRISVYDRICGLKNKKLLYNHPHMARSWVVG